MQGVRNKVEGSDKVAASSALRSTSMAAHRASELLKRFERLSQYIIKEQLDN